MRIRKNISASQAGEKTGTVTLPPMSLSSRKSGLKAEIGHEEDAQLAWYRVAVQNEN
jgi:hypothetical protein